jgi:regulator of replication initiation timing
MADNKIRYSEELKNQKAINDALKEAAEIQKEMGTNFSSYLNKLGDSKERQKQINKLVSENNLLQIESDKLKRKTSVANKAEKKALDGIITENNKLIQQQQIILANTSKTAALLDVMKNTAVQFASELKAWDYLMSSDKAIKSMSLNLGLSVGASAEFRQNIYDSSTYAASLGVSIDDLVKAQNEFVNITGTAGILTESMLKDISAISAGTGMGVESAAKLAANFETIGISAGQTAEFVTNAMNSGNKLGLSGTKTINILLSNFDKLQKYRFQGGVEAFQKMAEFSMQQRMNMDETFKSIDKFRTIEGTIEASAQLFALGGKFANVDPFEMGFLARNKPEEFAKKINKMTEGLAVFNKETGELQVSAVDMDRLRAASDITGQSVENLVEQAQRLTLQKNIGKNLIGLDEKDRAVVANLAKFDKGTKTYRVSIDGESKDISTLIHSQIEKLTKEQVTLEQRAKSAQTFDDSFKNTVNELKTGLLPILDGINWVLDKINSIGNSLTSSVGPWAGIAAKLTAFALSYGALSLGRNLMTSGTGKISSAISGMFSKGGGSAPIPESGGDTGKLAGGLNNIPSGANLMSKAAGIAAIGVAAAGIGAGIMLAADGVSKLAVAFKGLSGPEMAGVAITTGIIGIAMTSAITAVGGASEAVSIGLLALGVAAVGIGAGINLAARGMGSFVESLTKASNPMISKGILDVGLGIGALGAGMSLLGNPLAILGLANLALVGTALSASQSGFSAAGNAFASMATFLNAPSANLDKLKQTIDTLKDADTSIFTAISDLKNLLSKPIKMEFADKSVAIKMNVDLYIDKDKISRGLNITKTVAINTKAAKTGGVMG